MEKTGEQEPSTVFVPLRSLAGDIQARIDGLVEELGALIGSRVDLELCVERCYEVKLNGRWTEVYVYRRFWSQPDLDDYYYVNTLGPGKPLLKTLDPDEAERFVSELND